MKKVSGLIIIACLLYSAGFSQTVREKEKESILENRVRSKIQYDHKYVKGKPTKTGKLSSRTEYDANGNIVLKNYYGEKNEVISWEKYDYDTHGNRTLFERSSSSGQYKKRSDYDDEDRIVLESGYDGSEPFKTIFRYDSKGKPVEIIYSFSNQVDEKRVYEYNGNKATVKVLGGGKNLLSLVHLTYDSKGNLVQQVVKSVDGKILETTKYTYTSSSKVLTETKEKNGKVIYTIYNKYDTRGNLVEVTEESVSKGKFVKKEFTYNPNGKLIEYKWRRKADEQFNKKTYNLSADGLCVEEYTYYPGTKYKSLAKYEYERFD